MLFQHVTHQVFKQIIKVQFQPTIALSKTASLLTDIEVNTLRYVAGYVCCTLHDHFKVSSVEGKDVYLSDLNGSGDGEEWINAINCGGLWQVNDEVFQTFLTMGELFREELCLEKCTFDTRKEAIIDKYTKKLGIFN